MGVIAGVRRVRVGRVADMRLLMVCLGNICRSPTAEAAVVEAAEEAGLTVEVSSAGTGGWHVGAPPDERMTAAAAQVGLELSGSAAQVSPADIAAADLVLAMDRGNHDDLVAMAPEHAERIRMFREFDPVAGSPAPDVPDPYYGGPDGFAEVVEIVRRTARGLVEAIRSGRL